MKLPSKKFGIRVAAAAARSVGVALAFAIFAAALLGSAPVWSQSAAVLSLVAVTTDTTAEGGDDLELRIGLPPSDVGSRVEVELTVIGTAVRGTDYSLIAAAPGLRIMLGTGGNSTLTLVVESAPAELSLRLRPRADDRISQGDRRLSLRLSRYRVEPASGAALDLTILDDEPPTVQQLRVGQNRDFACVVLNGGSVRCAGNDRDGKATPPPDLAPVAQLALGVGYSCALTVSGRVRCWGFAGNGRTSPPGDLEQVVQLVSSSAHSCALTALGQLRCWGFNFQNRAMPPEDDQGPFAQMAGGNAHNCALTVGGEVHCWGNNENGRATPPTGLDQVAQIGVGEAHSCALTVGGEVHCWGNNGNGRATPPMDLGKVVQLAVSFRHTCALTVGGQVRCWGSNASGRSTPPDNLGRVVQLAAGQDHTCARTDSGQLRCWGGIVIAVSSLPAGLVTAVDFYGICALLAEGSVYCGSGSQLIPPGLGAGGVVMSVWPRQLQLGQRAAIHFSDLRGRAAEAFTARFEVFGEGAADIGSYYRLLDSDGTPLVAEPDGSYRLEEGDAPMAWLEALVGGQGQPLRLYVLPLDPVPSGRRTAQRVELVNPEPFVGSLTLRMHGGARQLLTAAGMARVPLQLSLADSDGSPLSETSVFTARLQGMVSGDATVVPAGPFAITASDTVAGTAELMVIFGESAETTLHFSVAEPSTGTVLISMPTALRVTRLAPPDLDVDEDDRVGAEDVVLLLRFLSAGPDSPSSLEAGLQQRLESLLPEEDVVDLRLDLDGNSLVEPTDVRFLLRYLAGLRGLALGENVQPEHVEAVFPPNR